MVSRHRNFKPLANSNGAPRCRTLGRWGSQRALGGSHDSQSIPAFI